MTSAFVLRQRHDILSLERTIRELPTPGATEVLIRVDATSLNYRDLLTRGDATGVRDGLVPLSDGAGHVEAVGEAVTRWKVGDRVSPNFFADWIQGPFRQSFLPSALGGGDRDGMLQEFVTADESAIVAIPSHLSTVEAATLPCAAVTAWHALFERGDLQAGQTVLVQGTGGVSLFGLQLAAARGAEVIVLSSSDDKLEKARKLGAAQTINYRSTPDWSSAVLEMTQGLGVDHILEVGGPETYNQSIKAIAAGGAIAQIGVLTGFASRPDMLPLQFKNASVNGICVGSVEQFARMNTFLEDHKIKPIIDREFSFDEAPDAYEYLHSQGHFGKIVVSF